MLKSSKILFFIVGLLIASWAEAQPMKENLEYFIFPIKPGERNSLAGTMGELRSTHFHTGIDIRTEGREGLPVFAAADGYITRIAVSPSGYGNALYVLHPNGQTTVYAHLKEFSSTLTEFVRAEQYKNKKFAINLFPEVNQFKVRQGDTIALSGNSGSSGGPHLHFDLRDKNHALLNPLSYGFDEIIDTRSPLAKAVALVTFSESSRIDNQFGRLEFQVKARGNDFVVPDTIEVYGKFGMELYAWDRMNGTRFKTGINTIRVHINDAAVYEQNINTWPFSKSRYFYQHINFETMVSAHKRFHKLYVEDGNKLDFYGPVIDKGLFVPKIGEVYKVKITMKDSYGNTSDLYLILKGAQPHKVVHVTNHDTAGIEVFKNYLKITAPTEPMTTPARFYVGRRRIDKTPAYFIDSTQTVYLWNMNKDLPDSIVAGNYKNVFNINSRIPAEREFKLYNEHADIVFSKGSLFDSLYLSLDYVVDTTNHIEILSVGDGLTPLKNKIQINFRPDSIQENKDKFHVYQWYGGSNFGFVGGKWNEDRISFKTRNLGKFTVLADTLAPEVKPLIVNKDKIVFRIKDERSGIKNYEAFINDQWVLMYYDPKTKWIWAERLNDEQSFKGGLTLKVSDNAGNINEYNTNIN